jgi:hypothetical protein
MHNFFLLLDFQSPRPLTLGHFEKDLEEGTSDSGSVVNSHLNQFETD